MRKNNKWYTYITFLVEEFVKDEWKPRYWTATADKNYSEYNSLGPNHRIIKHTFKEKVEIINT